MILNKPTGRQMFHIVQRPDRLWELRKFGEQISLHGSDVQAIDYAITLADAGQAIVIKPRKEIHAYS